MRKKVLTVLAACTMAAFCVGCAAVPKDGEVDGGSGSSGSSVSASKQLELFKSDVKLTQEQQLSRIKAEYLRENNGYKPNDEVVAILTLNEDALIDGSLESNIGSVADYLQTAQGREQKALIEARQSELIRELTARKLITGVEYQYSTVANAIAVKTQFKNFEALGSLAHVQNSYLSDTYNRAQAVEGDASAITNDVNVYDTGIFDSSAAGALGFSGQNTAVAVLDSGFDCSHTVFNTVNLDYDDLWINRQNIQEVLGDTNAAKFTRNLKLTDVWYSNKIPFKYDYADKDDDVFPYDSEHGTHVAGIIGGYDQEITGVAIDTQLVLLKVFPNLDDGAKTEDILAALEDAVLLNVDAINMSLGSSCGFSYEGTDKEFINKVYEKIDESGVSLVTAASNSYNSAFGGEQGNTNLVTNPDSGTVGSPSTYPTALSVASVSGVKSKYLVANDSDVVFFNESNSISGDPNDFFKELFEKIEKEEGAPAGSITNRTLEYVTIPGVGLRINYQALGEDAVKGKVALVRRGDSTFEDKALQAKNAGAIACIIYNNVDGDISMSMGKTDHIPTISISKDMGTMLASRSSGTIVIDMNNQAGPFMSDFSSWGPSPDLSLKPEITAHGGEIRSSIPGGGYDNLSGTSMASPNLCGIVVLIRQYLKEKYPDKTPQEIVVLANQMLMSTATIVRNEEGNPYSPRKQGAGLASLENVINTKAYLSVDGIDRAKLELKDDPSRTGEYTMNFNVVNISNKTLKYDLSVIGMTENVSTADHDRIAERDQILGGTYDVKVEGSGSYANGVVTVNGNETLKITVKYRLSSSDKEMIDNLFPYGMYVEGFVKLTAKDEGEVNLNIPFLAFYGDWTQAPMFDKTYYEVEAEAHNNSIDEEDKLKADYYATTPYGSYFYNYIIPLGTYLYDVDTSAYNEIPARLDRIALSNVLGSIDGISAVYAGLLRNAKTMTYTIVDKVTGEEMWRYVNYNANKAYSVGGSPIPSYDYLNISSMRLGLINNHQYEFKMTGLLDYGDGGATTNARNVFSFDFYFDDEAPVIKSAVYEKEYDKTLKKDRYYVTLTLYDNQYVQSVSPILFTSSSSYTFLTDNPVPVYSEQGKDSVVRIEITDYLDELRFDALISSALAFSIDDYALNSNIYLCELPGTRGDFTFTTDGTKDSNRLEVLTIEEGQVVDLTDYLVTADKTVDENRDYLKYLLWETADARIAEVQGGQVLGVSEGRTRITVTELMELNTTYIVINVVARKDEQATATTLSTAGQTEQKISTLSANHVDNVADEEFSGLKFTYFDTVFAYSRGAQTSAIGQTGDKFYFTSLPAYTVLSSGDVVKRISCYPGEQIKLHFDILPWYIADRFTFDEAEARATGKRLITFSSNNLKYVKVEQDGTVTALSEGSATVMLTVEGSNISTSVQIVVRNPFVIENRTLVAYKGLGGEVVIPDDEGILYIESFAFCLYTTDTSIVLTEEDYDANKIPAANTSITKIVIPHGVEDIRKYAFYNCTALKEVVLPDTVKFVRDYCFGGDTALETINLENVYTIGGHAFEGCVKLNNISLAKAYAIGERAFRNCTSLESIDLTHLRNTGAQAFNGCTSLESVVLTEDTKLSYAMFARSGLKTVDIYERISIPDYCFTQCEQLETVTVHNDVVSIGLGAFGENPNLRTVNFEGSVGSIGAQAFYKCTSLASITLPGSKVSIGDLCFYECEKLETVVFAAGTQIDVDGSLFAYTNVSRFEVKAGNANYSASADGSLLLDKAGNKILLAAIAGDYENYTLDSKYTVVGASSFAGTNVKNLTILNPNVEIQAYAFARCDDLETVTFPARTGTLKIGAHAFDGMGVNTKDENGETIETNHITSKLVAVNNLGTVKSIGEYAFARTAIEQITIGSDTTCGEGAFFYCEYLTQATIGANAKFGLGAFQYCLALTTVNMPNGGGVSFGMACFAFDSKLSTIDLSKTGDTIADQCFYGCYSLKTANLTNVKNIGDYAFADCLSLSTVTLPVVEVIGEGAFSRSTDYTSGAPVFRKIELPETLKEIKDGAFLGCEELEEIIIPSSIEKIGDYTFSYCLKLGKVVLPESLTHIGVYAFAGCASLTEINLEHVKTIDEYAFTSAEALETVNLAEVETIGFGSFAATALGGSITANNLKEIGDYAFKDTRITSFTAFSLEKIGEGAFQGNSRLMEFVLSQTIKEIKDLAFNGCTSLQSFYYLGGNGKTAEGRVNSYALLHDGVLYTTMASGNLQLTSVPTAKTMDTFEVLEGTQEIAFYAGNENRSVRTLILPDSLRLINNYAFYGYTGLRTVEFRSVVAPLLASFYERDAVLDEDDPGFGLLHDQFDLFGFELCYKNFVTLAGKPINGLNGANTLSLILPKNENVEGYDNIIYEAYFGKVENAARSDYEAMEKSLRNFIEYAQKILAIETLTTADETLVNNAVSAMNAITQSAVDYGYSAAEFQAMKNAVSNAKQTLFELKIANSSKEIRDLQADINKLPTRYKQKYYDLMKEIEERINNVKERDRAVLDLTKYNALVDSYNAWLNGELADELSGGAIAGIVIACVAVLGGAAVAVVFLLKKKKANPSAVQEEGAEEKKEEEPENGDEVTK